MIGYTPAKIIQLLTTYKSKTIKAQNSKIQGGTQVSTSY